MARMRVPLEAMLSVSLREARGGGHTGCDDNGDGGDDCGGYGGRDGDNDCDDGDEDDDLGLVDIHQGALAKEPTGTHIFAPDFLASFRSYCNLVILANLGNYDHNTKLDILAKLSPLGLRSLCK